MSSNNPNSSKTDSAEDSHADLNAAVEDLLNSLSNKFAGVSSEIFAKNSLETELRAAKDKDTGATSNSKQ
ncbi:unnamed protein product [Parascedosporium putredinis]|uniref:Heat shock factor binding protein 1 n=1 Tax=Parascedosporium putredinis TaxID=1442378 RepID=A0A9P1M4S6_9PEZI|nr:unnamed protein product [Parascedosporium putredinis]CAI7987324.1 unnamed protein product [Parascedosporium putredinis]